MSKQIPAEKIRFTVVPCALLRCPYSSEDREHQFWNGLWHERLRIFGRVFPWVHGAIMELAGLPSDGLTAEGTTDRNRAFVAAHERYLLGSQSMDDKVVAIHCRQNRAWEELTNVPPLAMPNDWWIAAVRAGALPPDKFSAKDFARFAGCIVAWAKGRQTNMPTNQRASGKGTRCVDFAGSDLRTLLMDTAEEINRLRGVVTDVGQLKHEVERVFEPTAYELWRQQRAGVLGVDWVPCCGTPIDVGPGHGVWLWLNLLWPFLVSMLPPLAANAGANNLPRVKVNRRGQVIGRDGKVLPLKEHVDPETGEAVRWEIVGREATSWDNLTPSAALHVFRQRYGDWADILKKLARLLPEPPQNREDPSAENIEWSKPVTKKHLRECLGISPNTLRDRLVVGKIPVAGKYRYRAPKRNSRKVEVAIADLPTSLKAKFRPKA